MKVFRFGRSKGQRAFQAGVQLKLTNKVRAYLIGAEHLDVDWLSCAWDKHKNRPYLPNDL